MFGVVVTGARRVALRFEQFPEIARAHFLEVITALQAQMQTAITAAIPKRTGRLAASVTGGVENSPTKVRGWVNVAGKDRKLILQAAALEYGASGVVKVKAKEGRQLYTVYGRYINPMLVNVDAYSRQADIIAQRFMRGPLEAMAPAAASQLQDALFNAVGEANVL